MEIINMIFNFILAYLLIVLFAAGGAFLAFAFQTIGDKVIDAIIDLQLFKDNK
jgi:ABC-type microcin C transport system permease subunit YejB